MLVLLGLTLKFIKIWLKSLKEKYLHRKKMYCEEICEMLNNIIIAIPET